MNYTHVYMIIAESIMNSSGSRKIIFDIRCPSLPQGLDPHIFLSIILDLQERFRAWFIGRRITKQDISSLKEGHE
jgi:hypothetical protein